MHFRATMGCMPASDVAPLPRLGEVFFDVRGNSRTMRLSWYAETGVAVFSIWQGGTCTGTFRVPITDLPRLVDTLQRGPGGGTAPAPEVPATGANQVQGAGAFSGSARGLPGADSLAAGTSPARYPVSGSDADSAQDSGPDSCPDQLDPAAAGSGVPGRSQNAGHAEPATYLGYPDPASHGGQAVTGAYGAYPDPAQPGATSPAAYPRDLASYGRHPDPGDYGARPGNPSGGRHSGPAASGGHDSGTRMRYAVPTVYGGHPQPRQPEAAGSGGQLRNAPYPGSGYPDRDDLATRSDSYAGHPRPARQGERQGGQTGHERQGGAGSGGDDHEAARYPDPGRGGYPDQGRGDYPDPGRGDYPDPGRGGYPDQGHAGYPQTDEYRWPAELPDRSDYQEADQFSRPAESTGRRGHADPGAYRGYSQPDHHRRKAGSPGGGTYTEPHAYGGRSEAFAHGADGNAGEHGGCYPEAGIPPPRSDHTDLMPAQLDPGPPTIGMTPPAGIPGWPTAHGGGGSPYPPDPPHGEAERPGTVPYGYPPRT